MPHGTHPFNAEHARSAWCQLALKDPRRHVKISSRMTAPTLRRTTARLLDECADDADRPSLSAGSGLSSNLGEPTPDGKPDDARIKAMERCFVLLRYASHKRHCQPHSHASFFSLRTRGHGSFLVRLFSAFDVAEEDVGFPIRDRILLVEPQAAQVGVEPISSDAFHRARLVEHRLKRLGRSG